MELYVVQWCNTEDLNDIGVECFTNEGDAEGCLLDMIDRNYAKNHEGEPKYKGWKMNQVVDSKALHPYVYKMSSKTIVMIFK